MLGKGGSLPVTEVTIRTHQLLLAFSRAMLTNASQSRSGNPSKPHSVPPYHHRNLLQFYNFLLGRREFANVERAWHGTRTKKAVGLVESGMSVCTRRSHCPQMNQMVQRFISSTAASLSLTLTQQHVYLFHPPYSFHLLYASLWLCVPLFSACFREPIPFQS